MVDIVLGSVSLSSGSDYHRTTSRLLDDTRADLRFAVRALRRAPVFAATAIVILALGIGATTALFSAVKGLLLDPLKVADPDQLVRLRWTGRNFGAGPTSEYGFAPKTVAGEDIVATFPYPVFDQFQEVNDTLSGMFASAPVRLNLLADERADIANGLLVSGGYFDVLGVRALLGRTLGPDDDHRGASAAAVISHSVWASRFGGDPGIVGRVVSVNGVAVTVVGVLPARYAGVQYAGADAAHVHLPLALAPQVLEDGERRFEAEWWWLQIMGRLRPGVTAGQVEGDLGGSFQAAVEASRDRFFQRLPPEAAPELRDQASAGLPRLLVDSGRRGIYDPDPGSKRQALVVGVVVGLVLLIACTNVANLLLSRAATRRREIALRRSVGATRARVVRQLVTEGIVLSALGGGLGWMVALGARGWLPFDRGAPFDGRVLAFVAILCLATGLSFSLVPALRATGVDTAGALQESSRSLTRSHSFLSGALLVLQVAVSTTLVVGAGLFLATLANLRRVDVGFDPGNVLLFRVDPRLSGYDAGRASALYDRLAETLRALPGVRSVSWSTVAFLTGSVWTSTLVVEDPEPVGDADPEGEGHRTLMNGVSPEFFATMDIPLLAGRLFDARDRAGASPVAIVGEAAARAFFGDRDALGRRLKQGSEYLEVVGVVRDVKYHELRADPPPTVYRPEAQLVAAEAQSRVFEMKTAVPAGSLIATVRDAVRRVDHTLPLIEISTQEREIEERLAQERLLAFAYSLFGGLTMLLASIGLYGLASYGVAQRIPEIGIRMALGARREDVARMVIRETLGVAALGVIAGVAAALAAGRLIQGLLFGLAATDAPTIAMASASMGAVTLLAAYLPARRAARVDPMIALRHE